LIKNPVKMVVVMCLILCSKFAKNRFSAGLCPDPLGELTAPPDPIAGLWGREEKGEKEGKKGKGRGEEERGGGEGGEKRKGERGKWEVRGIPRMKILATALAPARQILCIVYTCTRNSDL